MSDDTQEWLDLQSAMDRLMAITPSYPMTTEHIEAQIELDRAREAWAAVADQQVETHEEARARFRALFEHLSPNQTPAASRPSKGDPA